LKADVRMGTLNDVIVIVMIASPNMWCECEKMISLSDEDLVLSS
jgi:hypothetical protein